MKDQASSKKYALITGATSGFGYEFSKLFAADGYNLVLVARSKDLLNKVKSELSNKYKVEIKCIAKDLFDPQAAREIYEETKGSGITIHALVNDAGQGEWGKFINTDLKREIDLIQLNIISVVSLTKLYLKDMVAADEGKILQVSSLLAKYPTPLMAVYAATKAFVLSFTEALINELENTNVTMTVLLPGAADTDFFHKAHAQNTVTYKETELSKPEDVARDGYKALMNDESKIVSGIKNKVQDFLSNVMPDNALAGNMRKQMEVSDKPGKNEILHEPSAKERANISVVSGEKDGDIGPDKTPL